MTFDPSMVTELALSRALTFLYTGVVELKKESEGIDETIKISQLLNLPVLEWVCESARKGVDLKMTTWLNDRSASVAKRLFFNKVRYELVYRNKSNFECRLYIWDMILKEICMHDYGLFLDRT